MAGARNSHVPAAPDGEDWLARLKVLVTGLSGVVGKAMRPALEERYEVSSMSRNGVNDIPDERNFKGNVADIDSLTE